MHLKRNVKMSQMDILDVLVEAALDAVDALDRLANAKQDTGAKQQAATWKSMLENPPDWGIHDLSEHVDSLARER